jgi:hypothetical protein
MLRHIKEGVHRCAFDHTTGIHDKDFVGNLSHHA